MGGGGDWLAQPPGPPEPAKEREKDKEKDKEKENSLPQNASRRIRQ